MNDDTSFNRELLPHETRAQWAARFYERASATKRVYRTSDDNMLVIPERGLPIRIYHPDLFDGVLGEIVDIVQMIRGRGGEQSPVTATLQRPELLKLFNSTQKHILPEVKAIVYEPVLVPCGNGGYEISHPGYNPASGVYYFVKPGEPAIRPLPGTEHLEACFSAVPFESQPFRANLLGWLLGGVLLDQTLDPPLLVVTGNRQGIGKSSVVQAAGSIITGVQPSPMSPHGSEFTKQLSAAFLESQRFLFLDNIVVRAGGSYDNTHLSTLLTQGFSKKVRLLGHSRNVSSSGILIAASLNDAKLSTDLATRSLPIKLMTWEDRLHSPYCKHYAVEHRAELYGELLWLGLQGQDDSATSQEHLAFRFRRWLQFVRPRIEARFGPMALDEAAALDEISQEMFHFGVDWHDVDFTVTDFVGRLRLMASRYPALSTKLGNIPSDAGIRSAFGKMLQAKTDKPISTDGTLTVTLRGREDKKEKRTVYRFEVKE